MELQDISLLPSRYGAKHHNSATQMNGVDQFTL